MQRRQDGFLALRLNSAVCYMSDVEKTPLTVVVSLSPWDAAWAVTQLLAPPPPPTPPAASYLFILLLLLLLPGLGCARLGWVRLGSELVLELVVVLCCGAGVDVPQRRVALQANSGAVETPSSVKPPRCPACACVRVRVCPVGVKEAGGEAQWGEPGTWCVARSWGSSWLCKLYQLLVLQDLTRRVAHIHRLHGAHSRQIVRDKDNKYFFLQFYCHICFCLIDQ